MKIKILLFLTLFTFCSFPQEQQFGEIGNLDLVNGGQIFDCRIGYRIIGKMNDDRSNIILYPTWFSGKSESLIGISNRLFDTTKFCIIAVDALGDGISTSPSNSELQKDSAFPEISIKDMVNSQYILLTEVLGINHIYGMIGGSMGGMQVFQWVVTYPDYMDKAIAYVGSPRLTPFDLMLWRAQISAIEQWEKDRGNIDDLAELISTIHNLLITTPEHKNSQVNRDDFETYITGLKSNFKKTFNPYNWKCQLKAMEVHDISVDSSMQLAAERIKSSFLIIVNKQDLIVNSAPAIDFADKYNFRKFVFDNNCGHLFSSCDFDTFLALVRNFFDEKALN